MLFISTLLFPALLLADTTALALADTASATLNENIALRHFDQSRIDEFKTDDDFDYAEPDMVDTWWDELKHALEDWWRRMQHNEATGWFFRNLQWILIGLLVLFLFLYLRTNALKGIFYKNIEVSGITHLGDDLHINEVDLDELLLLAVHDQRYRDAVRFHYLIVLRYLDRNELISWRPDKTDRQYLQEIKEHSLRNTFADLSYAYKYVWYGAHEINQSAYNELAIGFENFGEQAKRA